MSISGGVCRAFGRATEVGANCLQVFVKSNVQWRFSPLTDSDLREYRAARAESGIERVVAHACYLPNLATSDRTIRRRSIAEITKELVYAGRYGISELILHPGNHMGIGIRRGLANVARALRRALGDTEGGPAVLVETTAGAGTAVGSRFEEIAEIIDLAGGGTRLGMCLDTSHVFAAGYDISTGQGYEKVKSKLSGLGLLGRIKVVHANDSRVPLGSHKDRHEHIGRGKIGKTGFSLLMRDSDFADVPKILETPKGMCGRRKWDSVNIAMLRKLGSGS